MDGDCGILLAGERLTGLFMGRLLGVSARERAIRVSVREGDAVLHGEIKH